MNKRPLLLDLFCGAGGCAVGYHRAGFDVVGVDHEPQPRYPFRFVQLDAIGVLQTLITHGGRVHSKGDSFYLSDFSAIHASPPCQRFSIGTKRWVGRAETHPDLIAPTRNLLYLSCKPFVIENVVGAPLVYPMTLCGTMFGLRVFRHRLFETHPWMLGPPHEQHNGTTGAHRGYSTGGRNGFVCVAGHNFEKNAGAAAMGIDWMGSRRELAQAIPPAYCEWIGKQLIRHCGDSR